jgi:hypothetical protein
MTDWLPLVGVVIAQFVLVGLYLVKQRGDDRRRWMERQLVAYSEFLALGEDLGRRLGKVEPAGERNSAYLKWKSSYGQVMLMGSEAVRDAASDMLIAYLECLKKVGLDELEVEDAQTEMKNQESRVTAAVRRDLKIDTRPGIL